MGATNNKPTLMFDMRALEASARIFLPLLLDPRAHLMVQWMQSWKMPGFGNVIGPYQKGPECYDIEIELATTTVRGEPPKIIVTAKQEGYLVSRHEIRVPATSGFSFSDKLFDEAELFSALTPHDICSIFLDIKARLMV